MCTAEFDGIRCDKIAEKRDLCSSHYRQVQRNTQLRPLFSRWLPMPQRFWAKVDMEQESILSPHVETPCWLWTGPLNPDGYGKFRLIKNDKAHRVSWLLSGASIPKGMFVLHKCDVRNCVRPDHLFIGDNAINIADMVRKGRSCLNAPYGESCHSAKLRESQIIEIRARTDLSVAQASELFETSKSNIRFIRSGRTWRHVK